MNGKDYEKKVADYLRSHGYRHVRITGRSSDYGVDIVASRRRHRYAVQCKFYSKPVGVAAVQQVVGGMAYYNCDRAMVVTNNTFTRQARELASMNEVELLDNIKGRSHSALLMMILYYLLLILMMFTSFYKIAIGIAAISAAVTIFVLYLKYQAIRTAMSNSVTNAGSEGLNPPQQT